MIVDYLQLMTMPGFGNKSKNEEVSAISRSLKVLAKDLDIPNIALSQMSRRAAKDDNDHTPQLTDLRDSGAIEQDTDTVLFIDRPDYYKKAGSEPSGEDSSEKKKKLNRDNSLVFLHTYICRRTAMAARAGQRFAGFRQGLFSRRILIRA